MGQFAQPEPRNPTASQAEGNGRHGSQEASFTEKAREQVENAAEVARDQVGRAAETAVSTAKEYPLSTLALAAGIAFAVGALWKAGRSQPSRWDILQSRLPDMPSARQLRSYWR